MSDRNGSFVWYELMTSDPEAAAAFYVHVVGWTTETSDATGMPYTHLNAGEQAVGGLFKLPEEVCAAGGKPGWIGYIAAADVDAAAQAVRNAGGSVHREPDDIPGVGRFAIVADPHGAAFALFHSPETCNVGAPAPMTAGHVGWHELHAGDGPAAFDFYARQFGWQKRDALDMGAMGIYQLFSAGPGDAIGGIMTKMPDTPHPFWLYYFAVGNIDEAGERVKAKGGQILFGPQEVPGGAWIIQCFDPQGAMFALVGWRRG